MSNETPITKEGYDKVQAELDHLIKVEREELKTTIAEARELGDLKENAEYHSAKEKQSVVEGRIMQLQGVIANAQVIDPKTVSTDKIVFGATVTLLNVEEDETVVYKIVGEIESNMKEGKISYKSPLGKAVIGKEEGDTVIVKAPKGDIEYEVESFEYI
ncbi:transcription elongation factor GreA [Halobacteriovorax marinus]|uniref:Transcription elongation factor GreA n=1 Tax=Halobacteriovorax marinus (strain ATCC BAA-682 / DSM 15412 / SJ) TaxID=862908 RepID=E1X2Q3_HALMS|nr:transcription elongation factor GreA [Halobacteriovorax marinus]ATH06532.1 transcription elongation factor GreA [Halobacteriovorax marinus]CBW25098.1 transcription elongation factor greA [Halobacteriovorax marinus SJ]